MADDMIKLSAYNPLFIRREDALAALLEMDEALHPWGDMGVVPTEPGEYWASDGRLKQACTLHNDESWDWYGPSELTTRTGLAPIFRLSQEKRWRFRKRWTPSPPEVTP